MQKAPTFKIIDSYIAGRKVNIELSILKTGLQKLQYVLSYFDYNPSVTFFAAPDFSVSINNERTRAGFCIGGILNWGDGATPVVPLELMLNSCGTLLAEIKENIDSNQIIKRISKLRQWNTKINGLETIYDISYKNHFANLYFDGEKKYMVIHSSLPEVKADNDLGSGVYFTESLKLQKEMKAMETPFGMLRILKGECARDYYSLQIRYSELAKVKRKEIMNRLSENFTLISNENHLGFVNMNTCNLGCYSMNNNNLVLPVTIGVGKSAYLAKPKNIQKINNNELFIVPHGSGHKIREYSQFELLKGTDLFAATGKSGVFVFSEMTSLISSYNDDRVITNPKNQGLFEIVKKMEPLFESKINLYKK